MIIHTAWICVRTRNMLQAAGMYNTGESDDAALVIEVLNAYRVKRHYQKAWPTSSSSG